MSRRIIKPININRKLVNINRLQFVPSGMPITIIYDKIKIPPNIIATKINVSKNHKKSTETLGKIYLNLK